MLLKFPKGHECRESEVTDRRLYASRRRFLELSAAVAGLSLYSAKALAMPTFLEGLVRSITGGPSAPLRDDPTPKETATTYNNFYEFGTGKEDPSRNAGSLITRPWSVAVEGEVAKPGVYGVEDLVPPAAIEQRIYRMRCVEGWSMVIPWDGVPLGDIIKRFEPTSRAKFIEFTTLYDPKHMPGQKHQVLDWPYVEGLRMDEAMHPLTMLATGIYGADLPNQNGAPLRLVVPWKYGFKSIKSIVRMRFVESMPETAWEKAAPNEYGFYANVNPEVDHPRWSQKKERRIGEFGQRPTLPFNGYGEEVASLYTGMDLGRYF